MHQQQFISSRVSKNNNIKTTFSRYKSSKTSKTLPAYFDSQQGPELKKQGLRIPKPILTNKKIVKQTASFNNPLSFTKRNRIKSLSLGKPSQNYQVDRFYQVFDNILSNLKDNKYFKPLLRKRSQKKHLYIRNTHESQKQQLFSICDNNINEQYQQQKTQIQTIKRKIIDKCSIYMNSQAVSEQQMEKLKIFLELMRKQTSIFNNFSDDFQIYDEKNDKEEYYLQKINKDDIYSPLFNSNKIINFAKLNQITKNQKQTAQKLSSKALKIVDRSFIIHKINSKNTKNRKDIQRNIRKLIFKEVKVQDN